MTTSPHVPPEYFVWRKSQHDTVQEYVRHYKQCVTCERTADDCYDGKRFRRKLGEIAEQAQLDWFEWVHQSFPRVLPASWRLLQRTVDGAVFVKDLTLLSVIVGGAVESDGKRWLHVSGSRDRGRELPPYPEMVEIKNLFIGEERTAYQVFAAKSKHVALREVAHIWCCFDGDPLPDFTSGGISL